MSPAKMIEAGLHFSVEVPGRPKARGSLSGRGRRLRLEVDHPELFAGPADATALSGLADELARHGIVIDVVKGESVLVSLGAVKAGWWHRRVTGSPHIRIRGLSGLIAPSWARVIHRETEGVLPAYGLLPPATLFPIAPTMHRHPRRRRVTTTHDPGFGGQPRLVVAPGSASGQRVHWLHGQVTSIGSDENCGIVMGGLLPRHVEIVHDEQDEFVVRGHEPDVLVNGAPADGQVLRTGSRLQVGPVTLVFAREEYADHGRPYGGRIGGEFGHQRRQPPRSPEHGVDDA